MQYILPLSSYRNHDFLYVITAALNYLIKSSDKGGTLNFFTAKFINQRPLDLTKWDLRQSSFN